MNMGIKSELQDCCKDDKVMFVKCFEHFKVATVMHYYYSIKAKPGSVKASGKVSI